MPNEMIQRVGADLRAACKEEFGSDWDNDVAWKFARVAIAAMKKPTDSVATAIIQKVARRVTWGSYGVQVPGDLPEDLMTVITNGALEESDG